MGAWVSLCLGSEQPLIKRAGEDYHDWDVLMGINSVSQISSEMG